MHAINDFFSLEIGKKLTFNQDHFLIHVHVPERFWVDKVGCLAERGTPQQGRLIFDGSSLVQERGFQQGRKLGQEIRVICPRVSCLDSCTNFIPELLQLLIKARRIK